MLDRARDQPLRVSVVPRIAASPARTVAAGIVCRAAISASLTGLRKSTAANRSSWFSGVRSGRLSR